MFALSLSLSLLIGCSIGGDDPSTAPVDFTDYDKGQVQQLQTEGLSAPQALFVALTSIEDKRITNRSHRIIESFPTGQRAVINVTVTPGRRGDPEILKVTHSETKDKFKFRLEYFVSNDAFPEDVHKTIAGGSSRAVGKPIAMANLASVAAAEYDGVQVIFDASVEVVHAVTDEFLEFADKELGGELSKKYTQEVGDRVTKLGPVAGLFELAKALGDGKEALALRTKLLELERQINALAECAKNPTNELTRKAYRDNPEERTRILKEVERVRNEVKSNTAVMFIGLLNNTASGLIKQAPWLGVVLGPGTAWANDKLEALNADLLARLKETIVKCGYHVRVTAITNGGYKAAIEGFGGTNTPSVAIDNIVEGDVLGPGSAVFSQQLVAWLSGAGSRPALYCIGFAGYQGIDFIRAVQAGGNPEPTKEPVTVNVKEASKSTLSIEWGLARTPDLSGGREQDPSCQTIDAMVGPELMNRRWSFDTPLPEGGSGTVSKTEGDTTYTIEVTQPE